MSTIAGMQSKQSKCTPIDKPIMKKIKMSHLSAPGSFATRSHFSADQKSIAVKKELIAYTSLSTALYQNESVKVPANAPTTPDPITVQLSKIVNSFDASG